jgi:hypothetical protein
LYIYMEVLQSRRTFSGLTPRYALNALHKWGRAGKFRCR